MYYGKCFKCYSLKKKEIEKRKKNIYDDNYSQWAIYVDIWYEVVSCYELWNKALIVEEWSSQRIQGLIQGRKANNIWSIDLD